MKNFRLWLIAALLVIMAVGPSLAGVTDQVKFKAGTGDEAVTPLDETGSTLTAGTVAGKPAKYLKSAAYGIDAIFVTLDEVQNWNAAYQACSTLDPAGTWRMPKAPEALGAFYLGILEPRQIGEIEGQPVATPPALWAQGSNFSENAQLQGKAIAMTFQKGIVGVDEQGRQQVGYAPQFFDLSQAAAGNEQKIGQLEEQKEKLAAETPESLAQQGYENVTQEQIDAGVKKIEMTIEVVKKVIESLKKGIPVTCVAGTMPSA